MIDQLPFVKRCLDTFGVSGEILPLPGEIDTNYLVTQKNSKKWVLKISPEDYDIQVLDFQEKLLEHLEKSSLKASAPMMKIAANGKKTLYLKDDTNRTRAVRMLTWIEGDLWSKVSPVTNELLFSLGQKAGQTTLALKGFDHHIASRVFDWNLDHAEWTENYIHLIDPSLQTAFSKVISQYKESKSDLEKLRKSVIHNDANDNNIITQTDFGSNIVVSIIDYGDAVKSTIINDVAVTATYAIMGQNDPLQAACAVLKGYHNSFPLEAAEVRYLYCLIGMRLVISLTKSAINKQKEPENEYLQISDQAAGRLLIQWSGIHPSLAYYSFRAAIGLMPHPHETEVNSFFKDQKIELNRMFPTENTNFISQPDMSIGSTFIGHKQEYNDAVTFWEKIKSGKIPC
ncbi:MAG: phosphotransferase [Saprospiraceae bacterium]|nr:phosphotransferase [Saprospiraceae bacterium]